MTKRTLTAMILSLSLVLPACMAETEPEPFTWTTPDPEVPLWQRYPEIYGLCESTRYFLCSAMPDDLNTLPSWQISDACVQRAVSILGTRIGSCAPMIDDCNFTAWECDEINTCWQLPGCELI